MTVGPAVSGERAWLYYTVDEAEPIGQHGEASNGTAISMAVVGMTWDTELWGYIRQFSGSIPGQAEGTIVRYKIGLEDQEGIEKFADQNTVFALFVAADPTPTWTMDAIIYHVFVDRFYPGDGCKWKQPGSLGGFYGGTIRGITEKLDYVQEIGFNTLWLSPIFPSPSHHGYDATDLFNIEPRLGGLTDFQSLIKTAHDRNIRIILDFVPNHVSDQHLIFQQAMGDPKSPYTDWFTFTRWPDEYETFFGVKSLPQLNLRHPDARKYMIDAAVFWLNLGVDGFRLDYAIGPVQEFWAAFRKQTRRANPECWTFGEVVDPPDVQRSFEGLLDGCLDFLMLEGIRQTFAFENWPASRLASFLDRHEAFFQSNFTRPSFLDNHDMNRFLWVVEGDQRKLQLAAMCQFSLSEPPIVYYGTEVGLSQQRDVRQEELGIPEEARLPMLWEDQQDQDLLQYYQELCGMRKNLASIRNGERETVYLDDQLFVFWRKTQKDRALIVLNIGSAPKKYPLPSNNLIIYMQTGKVKFTSERKNLELCLGSWSGAVLQLQETDDLRIANPLIGGKE